MSEEKTGRKVSRLALVSLEITVQVEWKQEHKL